MVGWRAVKLPIGSLLFSVGLIYNSAGKIWSHSFLDLKSAEANIRFLVIGEVLGPVQIQRNWNVA